MVIAMHSPNNTTATITLSGGLWFKSVRPVSIGPCEILQWKDKQVSIKNAVHIRLVADVIFSTGKIRLDASGTEAVIWIRKFDDKVNGPPELGCQGNIAPYYAEETIFTNSKGELLVGEDNKGSE
jgi:hypothetical protein